MIVCSLHTRGSLPWEPPPLTAGEEPQRRGPYVTSRRPCHPRTGHRRTRHSVRLTHGTADFTSLHARLWRRRYRRLRHLTGGRCASEVLWLQWDDVKLDEGFVQIVTGRNGHRTEGGKSRWVPMRYG
jgi:hypothetical protein